MNLLELARLFQVRDEDGRPLPHKWWSPARILNGEQIPEAHAEKTLVRSLDGHDVLLSESGCPLCDGDHQLIGAVLVSKTARAAEQLKDDCIALIAHELRSPLTTLLGYTEILRQKTARGAGGKLAGWQIEALETMALDVAQLVELTNAVLDAVKYSLEESEVLLTIEEDPLAGVVLLAVRDRGSGIPESPQPRIFRRFFRADNARALGTEGTGPGLHLCQAPVELHDGRIWFEPAEGKGAAFYVALPRLTSQML